MAFSLSSNAQKKSSRLEFKNIDTTVTVIAVLYNDTLIVRSSIDVFEKWFNKAQPIPKFRFIRFERPWNSLTTIPIYNTPYPLYIK